jgi:hypothetical protein
MWLEESKVVSSHSFMFNARQVLRAVFFALLLTLFTVGPVSLAYGQDTFSLTTSQLVPQAGVDPGGTATAVINLTASGGFDSPVDLSCVATSTQFTSDLPVCSVSPSSQTPPADGPSITITTTGNTLPGQYLITVTGTSGGITEPAPPLYLNVVEGQPGYTLSISEAISPGTVTPGSGAEATVTITPSTGYTGNVTLSCASVTPVVIAAPFCSFNVVNGTGPTVNVTNGSAASAVLTVNTYGTTGTVTKLAIPRSFYGFWLALPALALLGAGASRGHRKKWLGLLLLIAVGGSVLVLPSCGSSNKQLNNPNGLITPKNTYTITLSAVDANGVAPSNTTTTTSATSVSLSVN